MTRIELWIFKRILKSEIKQGYFHREKIINLYALIREAADNEFTEDTESELDDYCLNLFNRSQKTKK